MKHVGYERIILKEGRITIPDGVMLDIGAVGKGYASDQAAEILRSSGIASALLDLDEIFS